MLNAREIVKLYVEQGISSLNMLKAAYGDNQVFKIINALLEEKTVSDFVEVLNEAKPKDILQFACQQTQRGDQLITMYMRHAMEHLFENEINELFNDAYLNSKVKNYATI